jgi:hypothetical protein
MRYRHLTHDATDWIWTLEELKRTGSGAPSSLFQASPGEAGIDAFADSAHLANPDLASRIEQALQASGYPPLRNVHIWAGAGTAILRGAVPSYYMKQIAQAVVSVVRGVSDVHNELEVVPLERPRDSANPR